MVRLAGCVVVALVGARAVLAAPETLGADGFPAAWTPDDFAVGAVSPSQLEGATPGVTPYAVPVPSQPKMVQSKDGTAPHHKMVQLRVDQMKKVSLAPSGSAVIALPPVVGVAQASVTVAVSPSGAESVSQSLPSTRTGVLPEGVVGGPNVWAMAPQRGWEETLPPAFSRGVASPALKEAWRRLLLAETTPPDPAGAKGDWLAFRASLLEKLGMYEAAWSLWRQVPQAQAGRTPDLALGWVQSRLLSGAPVEACKLARDMAATQGPTSPWPVQVAVCQLLQPAAEGNVTAAGLSFQLIEPGLRTSNPALLKVLQAVQEGKPVGVNSGGPLGGAVLAAYPALIGSGTLSKLPDMALRRLMGSAALPVPLRAAAALSLANQTNLLSDGISAWQLVSQTSLAVVPDAVVRAGQTRQPAALLVPAALRAGDVSTAAAAWPQWQTSGTVQPSKNGELRPQAALLLAARKGPVTAENWNTWLAAMPLENALGLQAGLRLLLGLEAVNVQVPAEVWAKVHSRNGLGATGADPVTERLLAEAVTTRNVPRVYALAAESLAGRPAAEASAGTVAMVVHALAGLGQKDLAWRLLAEAVLPPPSLKTVFPPVAGLPSPVVSTTAVPTASAPVVAPASPTLLPPPKVAKPSKPTLRVPTVAAPHLGGKTP